MPVLIIKDSRNARAEGLESHLFYSVVPWQCLTLILSHIEKCINSSVNVEAQGFHSFISPTSPITALFVSRKDG